MIYRIPCECGMVYFGETGQWFNARVQQHQTAVKKLDVKNGIAAHVQQTGHTVRWSEAKCIDQHNYYVNRKLKEAIYINAYAPGEGNFGCLMNNDLGSHIDPIWKAISSVIQDSVKRKESDVYLPLPLLFFICTCISVKFITFVTECLLPHKTL